MRELIYYGVDFRIAVYVIELIRALRSLNWDTDTHNRFSPAQPVPVTDLL